MLNDNSNDDYPEINLGDFDVKIQYQYVTFDEIDFLSCDNDDAQDFIIPNDFIPTTNSGDIAVEAQEQIKYGFKFLGCNIFNNVLSLI